MGSRLRSKVAGIAIIVAGLAATVAAGAYGDEVPTTN
jgi:hypothetical protein